MGRGFIGGPNSYPLLFFTCSKSFHSFCYCNWNKTSKKVISRNEFLCKKKSPSVGKYSLLRKSCSAVVIFFYNCASWFVKKLHTLNFNCYLVTKKQCNFSLPRLGKRCNTSEYNIKSIKVYIQLIRKWKYLLLKYLVYGANGRKREAVETEDTCTKISREDLEKQLHIPSSPGLLRISMKKQMFSFSLRSPQKSVFSTPSLIQITLTLVLHMFDIIAYLFYCECICQSHVHETLEIQFNNNNNLFINVT